MRVGWQNRRSAPIGMGMVNCDYRVYAPLGWSDRMNRTVIIRPAESGPKGTVSRFSGTKKCISLGHTNRRFVCNDFLLELRQN
jgi:hypothetical protein